MIFLESFHYDIDVLSLYLMTKSSPVFEKITMLKLLSVCWPWGLFTFYVDKIFGFFDPSPLSVDS